MFLLKLITFDRLEVLLRGVIGWWFCELDNLKLITLLSHQEICQWSQWIGIPEVCFPFIWDVPVWVVPIVVVPCWHSQTWVLSIWHVSSFIWKRDVLNWWEFPAWRYAHGFHFLVMCPHFSNIDGSLELEEVTCPLCDELWSLLQVWVYHIDGSEVITAILYPVQQIVYLLWLFQCVLGELGQELHRYG